MPHGPRRRPWSLAIGGVVACTLFTACGPPEIDSVDLDDTDAQACRDLVAALPDTLLGEKSVEITGDTEYGAAWGDPAIVLTCGVDAIDLSKVPRCTVVKGVGWVVPQEGDPTVFTADGYRPRIQVVVPDDYAPEAEALLDLSPLVKQYASLEDKCL